jgi:hypothetical protein
VLQAWRPFPDIRLTDMSAEVIYRSIARNYHIRCPKPSLLPQAQGQLGSTKVS